MPRLFDFTSFGDASPLSLGLGVDVGRTRSAATTAAEAAATAAVAQKAVVMSGGRSRTWPTCLQAGAKDWLAQAPLQLPLQPGSSTHLGARMRRAGATRAYWSSFQDIHPRYGPFIPPPPEEEAPSPDESEQRMEQNVLGVAKAMAERPLPAKNRYEGHAHA
eukprot:TRINITY_DN24592_c0_g1_i1.p1 TRINITY_DN24592_c0_g1~~TRINITY_DN24592_c0_g1_i1.p1  ORF type:complete len:172 (+),score=25.39 TRINITY_DN24592_c0_g1_i1:32-517(+)